MVDAPAAPARADDYVLHVGGLAGRRNGRVLLESWAAATRELAAPPTLVLAGHQDGPTRRQIAEIVAAHPHLESRVELVDTPPDGTLGRTVRGRPVHRRRFALRGLGLPAGESLWHGTPCLCSDNSSLPEVCGDLALYFDPFTPGALTEALADALRDPSRMEAMRARIDRAALRRWSDVADDLRAALVELSG